MIENDVKSLMMQFPRKKKIKLSKVNEVKLK